MANDQVEIKSVNGKVLAFGLAAVTLLVAVICGALVVALFGMSSRYLQQEELTREKQAVIYTMQRALDRAEGRLAVYDEFIGDRRQTIVRKLIVQFLRKTNVKSTDVNLNEFENWVGVGGR